MFGHYKLHITCCCSETSIFLLSMEFVAQKKMINNKICPIKICNLLFEIFFCDVYITKYKRKYLYAFVGNRTFDSDVLIFLDLFFRYVILRGIHDNGIFLNLTEDSFFLLWFLAF
jgi:hypothetical protein